MVGGFVYRGERIPPLRGRYVFGDFFHPGSGSGRLFYLEKNDRIRELPFADRESARRAFITGSLAREGRLILDAGAEAAVRAGKSLLPAGVVDLQGDFEKGDAVVVRTRDGRELGRGLVNYAAADARRIIGGKTVEIAERLGYRGPDEIIRRCSSMA